MQREGKLAILHSPQIARTYWSDLNPGRRMLALVVPWARTFATWGIPTKSLRTGAGSSALKRMSRSPIVSARRRKLPQTSARITRACSRTASMMGVTRSSASFSKIRPPVFSRKAIPSRILASVLAPNPFWVAIAPAWAEAQIGEAFDLQRSRRALIFLGPRPGTGSKANIPEGVALRSFS